MLVSVINLLLIKYRDAIYHSATINKNNIKAHNNKMQQFVNMLFELMFQNTGILYYEKVFTVVMAIVTLLILFISFSLIST